MKINKFDEISVVCVLDFQQNAFEVKTIVDNMEKQKEMRIMDQTSEIKFSMILFACVVKIILYTEQNYWFLSSSQWCSFEFIITKYIQQ